MVDIVWLDFGRSFWQIPHNKSIKGNRLLWISKVPTLIERQLKDTKWKVGVNNFLSSGVSSLVFCRDLYFSNLEKSINTIITHFGNGTITFTCRKDEDWLENYKSFTRISGRISEVFISNKCKAMHVGSLNHNNLIFELNKCTLK